MFFTRKEATDYILDNDVKFLQLEFCDILGNLRSVSVMASRIEDVFERGVGVNPQSLPGYKWLKESILLLRPDYNTLTLLPWRPSQGRVVRMFCDLTKLNGEPLIADCRSILNRVAHESEEAGVYLYTAEECEFYLFKNDENGDPTLIPHDRAGYMDTPPLDKGELIRREICVSLEEMGLLPDYSHHEKGPGQNEIDFRFSDVITSADNTVVYRNTVRSIAAKNGLFASFRPYPLKEHHGNGCSLRLLVNSKDSMTAKRELTEAFTAGIIEHIAEISIFLNPTDESFERLNSRKANMKVGYSENSRQHLLRATFDDKAYESNNPALTFVGLHSPDSTANPYLAYSMILAAGLDGVKKGLKVDPKYNTDTITKEELAALPSYASSFDESYQNALNSPLVKNVLGDAQKIILDLLPFGR